MKGFVLAGLVSALLFAAAGSAQAATCNFTWRGGTGGDWMTAGNWEPSTVPTEHSNVCIGSGSAVLGELGPNSPHLASVTISGKGELVVRIHQVLVSEATTIGPGARLTLNGTYKGSNAGNASLGGGTVLNEGTITMEGGGYEATLYGTVTNRGTINIPDGTQELGEGDNGGAGSLVNEGAINVAAPTAEHEGNEAKLAVVGAGFNNASGTISNGGEIVVVGGPNARSSFSQGNAPITGNTVQIGRGTSLAWTGSGASSFHAGNAIGAVPMTGNIAAGQNLTVAIGTGMEEPGSFTNAGTITLNGNYPGCCGGAASIIIASGAMTNTGTIVGTTNDERPEFIGSVVNDGTIIATPGTVIETTTGSFVNGPSGTLEPEISSSAFGSFVFDNGVGFTAGGTLLPILQSFTPAVGQKFKVIAGSGVSGRFGAVGGGFGADYSETGAINAVYGATGSVPPPPPPPPPAKATAHVSSVSGGKGTVVLHISCPAGKAACLALSFRATVTEHLKGTRLVAVTAAGHKIKTKVVTVAAGTLASLAPGAVKTVTLKLNATGMKLLARYHSLRVIVTISENGKMIGKATVTVKLPAKKKKKK